MRKKKPNLLGGEGGRRDWYKNKGPTNRIPLPRSSLYLFSFEKKKKKKKIPIFSLVKRKFNYRPEYLVVRLALAILLCR